MRLLVSFRTS